MEAPNVYQFSKVGTAPRFTGAFLRGCPGAKLITDGVLRPGPVALWGEHRWYKTLQFAIAEGRTWYYGDHAYFGRGSYFRITKNALQWSGSYFTSGKGADFALKRFDETSKAIGGIRIFHRRQHPDGFVMVCPPSEALSERSGFTQMEWTANTVAEIKKHTNREIRIRQKPKVNHTPQPFYDAMQGAWCAVTYTGNIAVESMLGGWPSIVTGPSPARMFGNTISGIETAHLPDNETLKLWAAGLCCNQWTLAEIARGDAWRAVA